MIIANKFLTQIQGSDAENARFAFAGSRLKESVGMFHPSRQINANPTWKNIKVVQIDLLERYDQYLLYREASSKGGKPIVASILGRWNGEQKQLRTFYIAADERLCIIPKITSNNYMNR